MNLEDIMLSKIRQSEKDKYCVTLHEALRVVKVGETDWGMED
jgi:hypothetical protein